MINSVNMPHIPSIMSLHLRYRLWIAEMNSDINIMTIFGDCLNEIAVKKNEPAVNSKMEYFQKQFINLRKDIDALRHEMHLIKMKLAAYAKEMKALNYKTYRSDNHSTLKKQYFNFRKSFNKVKREFTVF